MDFTCSYRVYTIFLFLFCSRASRIRRCGVECLADSLFRNSFFPTFQVSPVFAPGMLDLSCLLVSGDVNVRGCFWGMLELGVFPWPGGFVCVLALIPVW